MLLERCKLPASHQNMHVPNRHVQLHAPDWIEALGGCVNGGNQRFETKHTQLRRALKFMNGHYPEVSMLQRENIRMCIDFILRGGAPGVLDDDCLTFIRTDSVFRFMFVLSEHGKIYVGEVDEEKDVFLDDTNIALDRVVGPIVETGVLGDKLVRRGRDYGIDIRCDEKIDVFSGFELNGRATYSRRVQHSRWYTAREHQAGVASSQLSIVHIDKCFAFTDMAGQQHLWVCYGVYAPDATRGNELRPRLFEVATNRLMPASSVLEPVHAFLEDAHIFLNNFFFK
jgi:hypothetical protein